MLLAMSVPHELEEFLAAGAASVCLTAVTATAYWLVTDQSPWPGLVLAMVAGFGWGSALLALTSPRRER
jgi:hypothetical protein